MEQSGMENMMDAENIVEEVVASSHPEDENYMTSESVNDSGNDHQVHHDINQQFLNVQEAVFNPETGTLQPISTVTTSTTTSTPPAPARTVKKTIRPSGSQQQVSISIFVMFISWYLFILNVCYFCVLGCHYKIRLTANWRRPRTRTNDYNGS